MEIYALSIKLIKKLSRRRCCYMTVDFAMATSRNDVCETQQMLYHIMIVLHDCSIIKDESNR
jgi:hypothetical protein